jgi:glycosyltransferase involved in cell wall biosynthesis/SAM-dependent methyltransferase
MTMRGAVRPAKSFSTQTLILMTMGRAPSHTRAFGHLNQDRAAAHMNVKWPPVQCKSNGISHLEVTPPLRKNAMTREELIRGHFDQTMRLIELGPSYNPIVAKADGWRTTTIDHASQTELLEKYGAMGVTTIDRIEPVDYVWQDGPITALIPQDMHGTFDGLVASHVGEHVPDLIGFFKSASTLLKPDGILALALPDKRVCFDFFQALTTTGDLVDAQGRTRHRRRTFFNQTAYPTTRNAEVGWAHRGNNSPFELSHSIFEAQAAYDAANEDPALPYQDSHAWAFTPKSFELLMLELNLLGHTDWAIRSIEPAEGVEFYIWLERKRLVMAEPEINARRLSLLAEIVYENRDAITQLDAAEAAPGASRDSAFSWPGPKPSIVAIIPLYNGARYIEEALNSVVRQTLPPTEIIVVNDGSTDNGAGVAIVERLARTNPITLLHKPNGGQSSARNLGVRESSSELIALLDQDDVWYENHLQELVKPFQSHSAPPLGWAYSNLDEINQDGALMSRSFLNSLATKHPKRHVRECIGEDMFILPSAALISRKAFEAVDGFDERLCGYEDDDLFLRMFRVGYANIYLDMPLSKWRIHPESTSYTPRMMRSRAIYTRKLLELFPDDPKRARYYARDQIIPRFGEHAIREHHEAVELGDPAAIAEALAEIRFLAKYDKSIAVKLFHNTLVHYRDALMTGDNAVIAAAWKEMSEAAAQMPEGRRRTRAALNLLRDPRISKTVFAMRRIARPAMRWAFSG